MGQDPEHPISREIRHRVRGHNSHPGERNRDGRGRSCGFFSPSPFYI